MISRLPIAPFATLILGLADYAGAVEGATAKSLVDCAKDYEACVGDCKGKTGFSCELLIKICTSDWKKCTGFPDTSGTLFDPGSPPPKGRPPVASPGGGVLQK
jgi:hypothetical protein